MFCGKWRRSLEFDCVDAADERDCDIASEFRCDGTD